MYIYSAMDDLSSSKRSIRGVRLAGLLIGLWAVVGMAVEARADPIPKGTHERRLDLKLTPEALVVAYRLDVDPGTAVLEDLIPLAQGGEFEKLVKEHEYYEAFMRVFAPRLARGLEATLDGKSLTFTSAEHHYQEIDPRNHLRFDFVFRAAWKLTPGTDHTLAFHEGNYKDRPGSVTLALGAGRGIRRVVPRLPHDSGLSPDERARRVKTIFQLSEGQPPESEDRAETREAEAAGQTPANSGLLESIFRSHYGFWIALLAVFCWGAEHALSPGHGKTLVAAYLVAERGTVAHAFLLGLVTTLTHTGVVLILATVLMWQYPDGIPTEKFASIQQVLQLVSGLLIAGVGFWLLSCRLAGKADHIHLGSGHHHHHDHGYHHHGHDHDHDHAHGHDHVHPIPPGWRGLVALGVGGGIVPCPGALLLLILIIAHNKISWAVPLTLGFSAGLAGVLILIGILVVRAKALVGKRWGGGRLFRALPVISAVVVIGLGLVLCYKGVHSPLPPTPKQMSSDTTGK